ncbi:MAG: ribosome silencing factor [Candidatus Saelkia tenebricola]|nr:ribosome silencing factor [Candidatus Saelkia tenebricola]
MKSSQRAKFIAGLIQDKKGKDILVMDMKKAVSFADLFIICSADSYRQVKTIADYVTRNAKKEGIKVWHSEGYEDANWILLDYGDIIVHIFMEEVRVFYGLERLWRDVPIEKVAALKE